VLPLSIKKLSKTFSKLPNIGPKSAEKLAIWFAGNGKLCAKELSMQLTNLPNNVGVCSNCGYFSNNDEELCDFCKDYSRNNDTICIVEYILDIIDIEESGAYKGKYFILGGTISPLEGKTISDLPFNKLKERVLVDNTKEIIIALGATTESDVTMMYIKELFKEEKITISVLARGIAVGTRIHYAGKKSLVEAFRIRESL